MCNYSEMIAERAAERAAKKSSRKNSRKNNRRGKCEMHQESDGRDALHCRQGKWMC